MKPIERVILGFGLAPVPLLAPLLVFRPEAFIAALPFTYFAEILIGLPIHLLLMRLNRRDVGTYVAITGLVALIAVFATAAISHAFRDPQNPFALTIEDLLSRMGLVFGLVICACVTAALFWWIAVRETRDSNVR
jgi:hypothetical protein